MARTGERSAGARMTARAVSRGATDIIHNITNGNAAEQPTACATEHRADNRSMTCLTARAAGRGAADILHNITNGNATEQPAAPATGHRNAACLTAHATRRRAPGIPPCASNPYIPREQPGKEVDTYGMD